MLVEFTLLGVSLVELVEGALLWSVVYLWLYLLRSLFGVALMQAKFNHHLCPGLGLPCRSYKVIYSWLLLMLGLVVLVRDYAVN